jgi:hypothetical protein
MKRARFSSGQSSQRPLKSATEAALAKELFARSIADSDPGKAKGSKTLLICRWRNRNAVYLHSHLTGPQGGDPAGCCAGAIVW